MTLYSQFVALVTGSTLTLQLRQARLKIFLFIALTLTALVCVSGYSVFRTTQTNVDLELRQRREQLTNLLIIPPQPPAQFRQQEENNREQLLEGVAQTIVINDLVLLLVLFGISWMSLYFLLLPISEAIEQRERFLAEASHELRTPLAILYSELNLSKQDDEIESLRETQNEAVTEIKRLQQLSDKLLYKLGHITQKTDETVSEVKLDALASKIWNKLQLLNTRNVTLAQSGYTILNNVELGLVHRLLMNLLDNVVRYAAPNTQAILTFGGESKLILELTNMVTSSEFSPGLGLSICKDLAQELGLILNYELKDGMFKVVVTS